MISGGKQIRNGFAFILGGLLTLSLIAFLIVFPLTFADSGSSHDQIIHAIIDFGLALLCVIMALRTWFNRNKIKTEKEVKKQGGVMKYFGIGMAIRLLSANTLPPFIGAIKEVSGSGILIGEKIMLCIAVILISMSTIILSYLMFIFNKEIAERILKPVNLFLRKNKNIISISLLTLVAVYLCYHGLLHVKLMLE